jgi:putative ABC transport system ATP-binding protein
MAAVMAAAAPAALVADELYRFYHVGDEETFALRGVSLRVEAGEMVAVTGPSGSGKSTLLACLAGLDDPDGGTVRVAGNLLSRRPERERNIVRKQNIGMLLQSANLVEHLSVTANVVFAQSLAGKVDRARARSLIDSVGLGHRRAARPSQLSGGEAARAGMAVALANNPAVLLADEPTGEVDAANEKVVLGLLQAQAEAGVAVVVVTHSAVVAGAAQRTVSLLDGKVVS